MCNGVYYENDGTCVGGTCNCANLFTGAMCENPVDMCTGVICQHEGSCIGGTCNCAVGFAGTRCE
ncbi:Hypothetical predicted protein, partial [Mytilus galloprovincialis]